MAAETEAAAPTPGPWQLDRLSDDIRSWFESQAWSASANAQPRLRTERCLATWEGDLILGKNGRSAIGTLVERSSRFVILLHLPKDHGPTAVEEAMISATQRLPQTLWKTLTWDRGVEMRNHARISIATDLDIYFCDPAKPWQRGSNENTNGLLRQYFPKATDLSGYHPDYLEFVTAQINNRPRKTLGWKTSAEVLNQILSTSSDPEGVASTA